MASTYCTEPSRNFIFTLLDLAMASSIRQKKAVGVGLEETGWYLTLADDDLGSIE